MVDGHYGAVIRKGAEEAGSVLLVINRLDGTHDLLEPPPGPAYTEEGVRKFRKANATGLSAAEVSERTAHKRKQDPDLWIVEVEDRTGFGGAHVVVE